MYESMGDRVAEAMQAQSDARKQRGGQQAIMQPPL